jgi:hypothetical protein
VESLCIACASDDGGADSDGVLQPSVGHVVVSCVQRVCAVVCERGDCGICAGRVCGRGRPRRLRVVLDDGLAAAGR